MIKRKLPVLDLTNYQKQGSVSVDMCCECIIHERRFQKPIKAIVLSSAYFSMFRKWVEDNYGEETAQAEFFIDTVQIRQETLYSGKSLQVEYFKLSDVN